MRPLHCLSLLFLTTSLLPRSAEGTYYFFVELESYSNPSNRDHDGGCCDPDCGSCDNYFIFCLRQAGYDRNSNGCPYGSSSSSANVESGSSLVFSTGSSALASGVPNPVQFAGNAWPGGFQLKIRVMDADNDADDLVDYFIIEDSSFLPTNEYTTFTTYTGQHSSSVMLRLRYRLRCRGNWHGYNCDIYCVDQDTDTAHLECALDGSRVCMDGWEDLSTQCTIPICQEGCHSVGGTCNQPGECNCEPGWSGDLCDECTTREGCEHGYCTHPNDCMCEEGYTGTLCNIVENPCDTLSPCLHGDCTNEGGGVYSCSCVEGYTGVNCDVDIDDCSLGPCMNGGICEDQVNGFSCSCSVGWTGDLCGDNIDECVEEAPCRNGSSCTDCIPTLPSSAETTPTGTSCTLGYICDCLPGFHGDNCDLDVDHCGPAPCQNGGVCHDGLLDYTCQCPPGYKGRDCEEEFDYCEEIAPCLYGATCTNLLTTELYHCTCPAGYTGRNCSISIDDCIDHACRPDSTRACLDGHLSYTCECLPGFEGQFCENDIDECERFGCKNGGMCVNGVGDFSCECPPMFSGGECEEPVDGDQCDPLPCLNGGNCTDLIDGFKCHCLPGYKGERCEEPSSPGPTSAPCGEVVCEDGETCVVVGSGVGEDGHKCEPCISAPGVVLSGCDKESAAQSDGESSNDTPVLVGASVGGAIFLLLLLLLLLLLILCCCCHSCLYLFCPCLKRDKIEEEATTGTLTSPYSNVSHNAMYLGPSTLFAPSLDTKPTNTLTKNGAMQNPMYAVPGGIHSDTLSSVPLPLPLTDKLRAHYDQLHGPTSPSEGEMAMENLEEEDHPYEQLGPPLFAAVATEYQKLSETALGGQEVTSSGNGGGYASLYNVPKATRSDSAHLPPHPPQLMPPAVGGARPENPYIISPASDGVAVMTTPATPEKRDLAEYAEMEQ